MKNNSNLSVIMMGATGAVGGEALKILIQMPEVKRLTLLGRRSVENLNSPVLEQHKIDVTKPETYQNIVSGHDTAICTLGVGQPSKTSKEAFLRIDKIAVIDFAKACKDAGVRHFELLSSVGINAQSSNFFLRSKGELVEELKALNFERLSIFQPSMILTPTNRYGFGQAVTLAVWPLLKPLLLGSMKKYRGVKVETLGAAFAKNLLRENLGLEYLTWDNFEEITSSAK